MTRTASNNMARGWALSAARLGCGLLRIKVLALALGVAGVGGLTLVSQIVLAGVTIVSMSMAVPIINLGRPAVAKNKFDEAGTISGTALALILFNGVVVTLALTVAGSPLLEAMGVGDLNRVTLTVVTIAVVLGALASGFWEGLVFLADRFDVYVKVGIASCVFDLAAYVFGTVQFGLRGALVALALSPFALLAAYIVGLWRDPVARNVLSHLHFQLRRVPSLLAYSGMMLGTTAATNVGLTLLRAHVVVEAGKVANGYLQTATALAAYMLTFITNGVWGHLHARAAAEGDTEGVRAELAATFSLATLIAFVGCTATALLAPVLLPLFYTHDFGPAAPLLQIYMAGEFAFQLFSVLMAYQLTIRRRRAYLTFSASYLLPLFSVGWMLIPRIGAYGYAWAHLAASLIALGFAATLCVRRGQLRPSSFLVAASLYGLLVLLLSIDAFSKSVLMTALLFSPVLAAGLILIRALFGSYLPDLRRAAAKQ